MPDKFILISGPISSGKSKLSNQLSDKLDARLIKTRDILIRTKKINSNDRISLQKEGDKLDKKTDGKWVLEDLDCVVRNNTKENTIFVVDSVRISQQIERIRDAFKPVIHLHLTAPNDVLKKRYQQRYKKQENVPSYKQVKCNKTEKNIETLAPIADVVIDTNRCNENDVFVRAASRMSLFGENGNGIVDVVVGGEYGSEGKGQIVAYLSKEYDLLVRVGGPNAGHRVFAKPESYTHHHLPSGTKKSTAKLLLGPGMVINPKNLLTEIMECDVESDRLSIDPQAMIIDEEDIKSEIELVKTIGSTGQGVGAATARKILKRNKNTLLAKDVRDLKQYIKPAIKVLEKTFANNGRVLLEGTQGTGLSIHHGSYPYVTSRETTVSGCLADAGIPPSRVRKVIMVCRTYPIRVKNPEGKSSGPMSQEISLNEISKRSKIPLTELKKTERTSTTNKKRRIGEFDWDLIKTATFLNSPTDIALTFADYLSIKNRSAKRFEQLTTDTINLIEEIERVTKAKISLIGTGFNSRSIIDRRDW